VLSTGVGIGTALRALASRLRNRSRSLLEASPWVFLGLSIVFLYIATYGLLVSWVYTTSGRVTYYARFFHGYESALLLVATLLSLYSATASLGFSKLRLLIALAYVALAVLTYLLRPQLLYIPYAAPVVLILGIHRSRALRSLMRGLAMSVALVELPALAYRVGALLGLQLSVLESAHLFSSYLNSSLWYISILVAVAVLLAPLASLRLRRLPISESGQGAGEEVYLALALLAALAVGLAGFSPAVNPRKVPIDVDWIHYYRWLSTMVESANPVAVAVELAGDRAAFLLVLYAVAKIFKVNLLNLCVHMEVVLLQLYTLASYYVAREYFGYGVARYAALLAPLTPHALSFIYGGFQADLFSLTITYLALGLSAKPSLRRLPLVLALSVLASLTHAWTWLQFAALVATYVAFSTVVSIVRRGKPRSFLALAPYVAYIASSTLAYLALRTHIHSKALDNFEKNVRLLWTTVATRTPDAASLWRNSAFYFNIYTGGTLTNYVYWPLVLASSLATQAHALLYVVTSLPLAVALAMYAYTTQSSLLAYRVTVNIPTHLAVARLFERMPASARVALYLSLLSLALGRVLSIVPKA